MSRSLSIGLRARADIRVAAEWHDSERPGLSTQLLDEIQRVLTRIQETPRHFPVIEADVRRGLLRRFPYAIYFVAHEQVVEVVAFLHLHRAGDAWKARRP